MFLILLASSSLNAALVNQSANLSATGKEAKQPEPQDKKDFAGEFMGIKVPKDNYYFVKGVVLRFGNKWGPRPTTTEEVENAVWQQLFMSFIAFQKNITVTQQEVDNEVTGTLNDEKASFDWKADKDAYAKWLKEKLNETPVVFENQVKHLIQIEKLRNQIRDSINPEVKDEEALQEFKDENSSINLELVHFDEQKDADDFYKKACNNKNFWDKEKKRRPKDFKQTSLVTLIFLIDIWKIPQDALYKMMQRNIGEIYPPRPVYKGYAIFKILEKSPADESGYAKAGAEYLDKVKRRKQYEGLNEWLKNLKEKAGIVVYDKEAVNQK